MPVENDIVQFLEGIKHRQDELRYENERLRATINNALRYINQLDHVETRLTYWSAVVKVRQILEGQPAPNVSPVECGNPEHPECYRADAHGYIHDGDGKAGEPPLCGTSWCEECDDDGKCHDPTSKHDPPSCHRWKRKEEGDD